MRSGAAAGQLGIVHDTAFYGSDDEFLAVVVPFLRDGVQAGEPTVSLFGEPHQQLVRSALGGDSGVIFVDGDRHYLRPAIAIKRHREMLAGYVADGAVQIRIAGHVPHPGVGVPWEWWSRYEAAANVVYDDYPMYGLCTYDTRITPQEVLDQARRTHTHVVGADGRREISSTYQDPQEFLTTAVTPWADPLQGEPPALDFVDPSPAQAREAVADLQAIAALDRDDLNGLLISTTEIVTNAILHGQAPARLQLWAAPGRMIVTVKDCGPGPIDPCAGLLPRQTIGGLGLWIAHQMCAYVSMRHEPSGFTIRLIGGEVTCAPSF